MPLHSVVNANRNFHGTAAEMAELVFARSSRPNAIVNLRIQTRFCLLSLGLAFAVDVTASIPVAIGTCLNKDLVLGDVKTINGLQSFQ